MSDQNLELKFLRRIVSGPLPIHSAEAERLAPLARYKEWKDAGLFDGVVILDGITVVRVDVFSPTQIGRERLAVLESVETGSSAEPTLTLPKPVTAFFGKAFWYIFSSALALLVAWIVYKMKWK